MRLGDIKVEALKLMFVTYTDDIRAEDLPDLGGEENYRAYLLNMNGSINRCLADIESRRILPVKRISVRASSGELRRGALRVALADVAPDLFDVDRVVREDVDGYCGDCEWEREGDELILRDFDEISDYRLLYYPRLPRYAGDATNMEEVPVPDEIAAFIPYFVKGDLYREDEINDASEARNWYEAAMEQIAAARVNKVNRVRRVYSQVDL